jgi:hypothetical protein
MKIWTPTPWTQGHQSLKNERYRQDIQGAGKPIIVSAKNGETVPFLEKQMVFAVNWRHCFNYDFDFAKTMSFVIWCVAVLSSNLPPTRTNVNRIIPMCIEP